MRRLLLAFSGILTLGLALGMAPAPEPEPPYCAGWYVSGRNTAGLWVLNPIVINRGPLTRVELWVYTSTDLPESAIGWHQIAADTDWKRPTYWSPTGLTKGVHIVTTQVFESERLVSGWQTRPQCILSVMS